MKKLILFFLPFAFLSCNNSVNFILKNTSLKEIDSLIVTNNFDTIKINHLKINSIISKELIFLKKQPKGDGNYRIISYENGIEQDTTFGYFSNGLPINKEFKIEIIEKGFIVLETN